MASQVLTVNLPNSEQSNSIAAETRLPTLAGTVLLSASLANFLNRNDYDFFRADVMLVVVLFAVVSLMLALLYRSFSQIGRSILEGFLVAICVDLNSSQEALGLGAGLAVGGYTFWKRSSLLGPMAMFGMIVLITTLLGIQGRTSWMRTEQSVGTPPIHAVSPPPAVLHIMLDEHQGLEGLSLMSEDGHSARRELELAYLDAGFAVFGRAYSQHMHTVNSIPQVLNYDRRPARAATTHGVDVGPSEHLNAMLSKGYRLNIFQSDFAEICSDVRYWRCTTYDSFSLRPTLMMPMSAMERAELILSKFLMLTDLSIAVNFMWNVVAVKAQQQGIQLNGFRLSNESLTSTIATFAALPELGSQLSRAQPGDAFVVHLLAPHYPYVVSRDCTAAPRDGWDYRNAKSSLEKRQHLYLEQVRCVTRKTLELVDRFRSSPAGKDGSVVIHGDHGSRITRIDPQASSVGKYSDADMIAAFSTIFAVQTPAGAGTIVEDPQPVAALFEEFARGNFATVPNLPAKRDHFVFLDDHNWRPKIRVRMADALIKTSDARLPIQHRN
jgi:hypothetical protein